MLLTLPGALETFSPGPFLSPALKETQRVQIVARVTKCRCFKTRPQETLPLGSLPRSLGHHQGTVGVMPGGSQQGRLRLARWVTAPGSPEPPRTEHRYPGLPTVRDPDDTWSNDGRPRHPACPTRGRPRLSSSRCPGGLPDAPASFSWSPSRALARMNPPAQSRLLSTAGLLQLE